MEGDAMKLIIDCCLFVLDNEENNDIRKNTPRTIKLLVSDNYEPIKVTYDDKSDIKELIREKVLQLTEEEVPHSVACVVENISLEE